MTYKKIPNDFFDLIVLMSVTGKDMVIGQILEYFGNAYQLGLTATLKKILMYTNILISLFTSIVFRWCPRRISSSYKIHKINSNLYREGLKTDLAEEIIYDDEIDENLIKSIL